MIGGMSGYEAAHALLAGRDEHPALDIPIVCLPATINNDVPGSELSVGADTALNSIVVDVDKIKQSAVASRRCFVVEVMGKGSGYLALTSGLATGAEYVYTPEEGITLEQLQHDVQALIAEFRAGQNLGLVIRAEQADSVYSTPFLWAVFEKEGGDLFDVRQAILGHVQTGGNPSPFDRIQATRLAVRGIDYLVDAASSDDRTSAMGGLVAGRVEFAPLEELPAKLAAHAVDPTAVPWFSLRPIADVMADPNR